MGRLRQALRTPDDRAMFRSRCGSATSRGDAAISDPSDCPACVSCQPPSSDSADRPRRADRRRGRRFPAKDARYHTYAEMVAELDRRSPTTDRSSGGSRSARATSSGTSGPPRFRTTSRPTRTSPGALRCATSRPGAPDRRAGTRRPALAERRVYDQHDREAPRRYPRDLHRLHGQPRRRRVRHHRFPVPWLAQEPAAELGQLERRHRPEQELRLPLRLLRRLVGVDRVEYVSWPQGVLGA